MENTENKQKLRKVAFHAVLYQLLSIAILSLFTTLGYSFDLPVFVLIGFIIIVCYSAYILKILIIDDNLCPNCHHHFFKRAGSFSNLGFSIYTKKCTNCKFKV